MAGKKSIYNSLCMEKETKASMEGKKHFYVLLKKLTPSLPSEHRGWNSGKGDCGHYHSHLDFSVHIGTMRGFMDERIKKLMDNDI